ncbi:Uma2 family endonuclease [Phormidesmis priestleyi ULC007]|uniref:Uma2 family endonuclease n=1 Tax=Phormidesmis priestleyi ULC007 TaxID=1920490 RepID=A0A2T1DCJ1_9CYAN|nr:Uma2 family endonuclease [Phormidesmis priestleyi]PSB18195.1 Uma2 family endonuclease [Phormidesmis priestleyi ULC007]PZO49466.1 MAG: Uma2 family endonuclease [Phormidesmis priestleyi]
MQLTSLTLNLKPALELTDEQFEQICRANRDLRFERTSQGELIVMSPTGGETGNWNSGLTGQLWFWNQQKKLGKSFDSSTGFKLPNGATRPLRYLRSSASDATWVQQDRWDSLTPEQKKKFIPLCPDFVIELRSPTDDLEDARAKIREYLENGASLGWLINPQDQQVEIYRPGQPIEILDRPNPLSEETVLPEFILDLREIWN